MSDASSNSDSQRPTATFNERALNDFFDSASVGMHWVGPDGIILRVNQAELDMLGYTNEEYLGHHIAEFHADQAVIDDILVRLTSGAKLYEFPARLRCKDGSIRDVSINSSVLFDSDEFIHTRCFTTDITERKQAEDALRASEEFNRSLMDSSADCIKVLDLEGRVLHMNVPGMCQMEIDDFSRICGKEWWSLWPELATPSVQQAVNKARAGETSSFVAFCPTAKQTPKWWEVTVSPVRAAEGGQVVRLLSTSRDITARIKAEQALRDADRLKDEFMATLAHELRNPLAPISNAAHILQLSNSDNEYVRTASEMMYRQVGQMVRLVDDLLDVSRISRGTIQLRLATIEVASTVRHVVEAANEACTAKNILLTVNLPTTPFYVNADPTRLTQMIGNLLNNAVKFNHHSGNVWLSAEPELGQAVIRLRDDGPGIAKEQLTRIFDMFGQVDGSLERSQSGLGIGLTLVQRLIGMHGGTVEVSSEGIGKGSEFVLRLPLAVDVMPVAPERRPAIAAVAPRRILVVDDNNDSAATLSMLLRLGGHETRIANDGLEAVASAESYRPDLVLLDIGLPKLNGYEVAKQIRCEPWGGDVRLVALTGWGQDEDRRKTSEAGFDSHLVKPIDFSKLEELLTSFFSSNAP
jgi:PAS domain S-box-containing protein